MSYVVGNPKDKFSHEAHIFLYKFQLLDTVGESTNDVTGLHAKVDRMKEVENHNKTCQQSFQEKYHSDVQGMLEQLNTFLTAQEVSHNTHTEHIGELLCISGTVCGYLLW